ncbi:MAG TPA: thiamine ABC transporter substrate binding subunit, partial [Epsilonproteobacteria bacterium]|nr:thiamine ABC transporter substrate binding subunit [Campylobacterota bacterium]
MIRLCVFTFLLSIACYGSDTKPTLTIYTYDAFSASWGPAPKIKKAFEKEHNVTLKFVGLSSSIGALRKIQLEGKRTKADVLLGLDTSIAQVAKKIGLFVPHELNSSKLVLPAPYDDDTFTPFDYSFFAFVYNSEKLKNVPDSFEALVHMPTDFKIVIQDPRSSTAGLGLLLWVKSIYGDKSGEYWKRLAPHILTITKGWSEAYGLFLKGEADMVLSYTTSPAYHIIDENRTDIKAAAFKEGHYGQIEVAATLKSSKQQALAKQFLAFLHTQTFAAIIPTSNWSYPV